MKRILVRVRPSARRSTVAGYDGHVLRVDVAAPAVENRANEELIRFMAKELNVSRGKIEILRGFTAREKLVAIDQSDDEVERWLAGLLAIRSPSAPNQ